MSAFVFSPQGSDAHALFIHVADLEASFFSASRAGEAPTLRLRSDQRLMINSLVHLRIAGVGDRSMPIETTVLACGGGESEGALTVLAALPKHGHRLWALRDRVRRSENFEPQGARGQSRMTPVPTLHASRAVGARPAPSPTQQAIEITEDWVVEAGPWLLSRLKGAASEPRGYELCLPCARPVRAGQPLVVTMSFGLHADPVELATVVGSVEPGVDGMDNALVRVVPSHAHRVQYVKQVVSGQRAPSKRSTQRNEVRVPASLEIGGRSLAARAESVSESGLFVRSHHHPDVGSTVTVALSPTRAFAFSVAGEVRWHSEASTRSGFGLHLPRVSEGLQRRLRLLMGAQPVHA